ncbi:acyl carrier protein [Herbinix luporum]|uniref:acyl carrier protein n=1 Tax=Herbinix luporum TaxID=1679721 RepID=UPI0023F138D3|nr:phosphopantetheine-binding protein [Herbinix luporum]
MSKAEILSKLQEIMKNVFDDETIKINNNTKRSDISDWDSLSQIRIVLSIEKKFNIKMDVDKAVMIETVGEFVEEIEKKINKE